MEDTVNFLRFLHGRAAQIFDIDGLHPAIAAFEEIVEVVTRSGSLGLRTRFLAQNIAHVQASGSLLPQTSSNPPKILTVQNYLDLRVPDSASPSCHQLAEHVYNLQLPGWLFQLEDMQTIIRETAVMVQTINDLLSLAKEVKSEPDAVSLIPILMQQEGLTAQGAVDRAVGLLIDSQAKFMVAEDRLQALLRKDDCLGDAMKFVQTGKDLVMGIMQWSYGTERYMNVAGVRKMENGDLICKLGGEELAENGLLVH